MDRLSIVLSMMTGATLTGALTVTALSLGYYSWMAIGGAAVIGFALAWPSAYFVSRWIKREDPQWRSPKSPAGIPRPDAPEV